MTCRLLDPRGLRAALLVVLLVGALWGLGEALGVAARGGGDLAAVLAFYPALTAGAGLLLVGASLRAPAEVALPRLAGGLVALAVAIPLAIQVNLAFVRDVPLLSPTNVGLVLGALVVGGLCGLLARALTRRALPALLAPRRGVAGLAAWAVPLALLTLSVVYSAGIFREATPGPWPDTAPAKPPAAGGTGGATDRPGGATPGERPPNVVLIVIDTLRADHVSGTGYARETTPRLDALPAIRFTRAYATGHWTVPSTASLLTGLHPFTHGASQIGSVLPRDATTLTQWLGRAGWITGYFTGNFVVSEAFGFTRGADWVVSERRLPHHRLFPSSLGHVLLRKVGRVTRADHLNARVLPFLRSVAHRPFFLYVHYKDPHDPYLPPAPYDRAFGEAFEGRRILRPYLRGLGPISEAERRDVVARYDGEIRFVDEQVGRLLDELERLGVAERTLVLVTSDHGEEFAEHGGWAHGKTVHEEIARVPLLLSWPPLGQGSRAVDVPVSLLDVAPTVLDIVGLPTPASVQGHSLWPLVAQAAPAPGAPGGTAGAGGAPDGSDAVPGAAPDPDRPLLIDGERSGHTALIHGRHKLIRRVTERGLRFRLYDLVDDPGEQDDLSRRRPGLLAELRALLESEEARLRGERLGAERRALDPRDEEALRQLGYLR